MIDVGANVELVGGPIDPELFNRNIQAAMVDTALQVRELLVEATLGPVSGEVAQVAELWQVIPLEDGAAVVNPSEIARYLEYGTGIYTEEPGAVQQPIRPRYAKVLSWVDKSGERHFAKQVRGYKGTAMVRNNLDTFEMLLGHNVGQAIDAAMEGRPYA